MYESLSSLDLASQLYKSIISECPDYIDAYHRLAYLARQRGDYPRALNWVDEASKTKSRIPVNQMCLKAKLLMETGKFLEASKIFKLILERMVPGDNYSFIGLANVAFKNALTCGSALQQPVPQNAQDPLMVKAFHKYLDIL